MQNRALRTSLVRVLALYLLVSAVVATNASAQGFISPLIGYNFSGDAGCPEVTGCEDKNLNLGVGLGTMGSVFGFEEEFAYAKDFYGSSPTLSSNVLTVMSSLMLVPKIGPVRPYFLIGAGLIKSHVEFTPSSLLNSDDNQFGWNIGGGLMVFFGDHVGIRGEIRHFHSFQDREILGVALGSQALDFGRASGALVFKF